MPFTHFTYPEQKKQFKYMIKYYNYDKTKFKTSKNMERTVIIIVIKTLTLVSVKLVTIFLSCPVLEFPLFTSFDTGPTDSRHLFIIFFYFLKETKMILKLNLSLDTHKVILVDFFLYSPYYIVLFQDEYHINPFINCQNFVDFRNLQRLEEGL